MERIDYAEAMKGLSCRIDSIKRLCKPVHELDDAEIIASQIAKKLNMLHILIEDYKEYFEVEDYE